MIVAVTGATGFIGRALVSALQARGDTVRVLGRGLAAKGRHLPGTEPFAWSAGIEPPAAALEDAGAVVHLAGAGIADKRWTAARKKELVDSRVAGTRNVVAGLRTTTKRPAVLVSASGVGVYGIAPGKPVDESSPAAGDFLARLCTAWEAEAREAESLGIRVVLLRSGVVLGKGGGALAKMLPPFKAGVGGPIGNGSRRMPWIHLDDEVGLILRAIDDPQVRGPLNAVTATAINRDFTKALGRAIRRPTLFPVPPLAIKALYGSEMATSTVLADQDVLPGVARRTGYEFRRPDLDDALHDSV